MSAHDIWGDLAALTRDGAVRDVRITCSAHKDPAKRNFLVSAHTRRRHVVVDSLNLERAAARLVEMAVSDAA